MRKHKFATLQEDVILYRNTSDEAAFRRIEKAIKGYVLMAIFKEQKRSSFKREKDDLYQEIMLGVVRCIRSPALDTTRPFSALLPSILKTVFLAPYGCSEGRRQVRFAEPMSQVDPARLREAEVSENDFSEVIFKRRLCERILAVAPPHVRWMLIDIMEGVSLRERIGAEKGEHAKDRMYADPRYGVPKRQLWYFRDRLRKHPELLDAEPLDSKKESGILISSTAGATTGGRTSQSSLHNSPHKGELHGTHVAKRSRKYLYPGTTETEEDH
jgi:DNA-directed RNA polymerase specialized sigma24 family protein